MKRRSARILSALLAAVMVFSLLPAALAAEGGDAVTGSVSATVRIDYAQTLEELARRNLQAVLYSGSAPLLRVPLTGEGAVSENGYTAQVSLRNGQGEPLSGDRKSVV